MPGVPLLLAFFLLSALVDRIHGDRRYWGKSPLPVFTRVKIKRYPDNNSTYISARYKANERPEALWFVDDVPFVGGMGNYHLANHYDGFMLCMATIIVPDTLGTRFAVCLKTVEAQNCLHLRPLGSILDEYSEDIDLPWPLLVPAPRARYYSGRKTIIFAHELDTDDYAYSGRFIFLDPGQSQPLRESEASDMERGQQGDVISMERVTSGSPGWILVVATDVKGYEGVLLFQTTIEPPQRASAIVERSISTRPINIYNRQHLAPFPVNFVAMLPHSGDALSVVCRPQGNLFCLISCPFIINGEIYDTELSLSRKYDNGTVIHLPRTSLFGLVKRTGKYLAEARFQLNVSDDAEPGIYQCSVALNSTITHTFVNLTHV